MKTYISIILIFLFSSRNENTLSIQGIQKNCTTNREDSRERYIKLWQGNKIIVNSIKTRFGEFKINNLSKGIYTLEYLNIYGQTCKEEIELTKSLKNYELCTDTFVDNNGNTLFGNLKKSDILTIEYSSQGCFHDDKEEIKFYSNDQKMFGQIKISNQKTKKVVIDSEKFKYLIQFEKKVRAMKNAMSGCTTSDVYKFKLNGNVKLDIIDDSCDWNGYGEMKKVIFGLK